MSVFKRLQRSLSDAACQKLLYLNLLKTILQTYPERGQYSMASPISPYFFDGQRVPIKHALLVLRVIKNQAPVTIRLKSKALDELAFFLESLWENASGVAKEDPTTVPGELKKAAYAFIEIGLQVERLSGKEADTAPSLFVMPEDSGLNRLFTAACHFGVEYYTFCLDRI